MRGWRSAIGIVAAGIFAAGAAQAQNTTLGDATAFNLLSTGGKVILSKNSQAGFGGNGFNLGMTGGTSAILKKGATAFNDVVTSPRGISLQKNAVVDGSCITTSRSVIKDQARGASCGSKDNSGTAAELGTMSAAISEAGSYVEAAKSQTAVSLAAIDVPKNGNMPITNDPTVGLHVFTTPSITLKKNATLTINAQSGDTDLIVVAGDLKWGAGATLLGSTNSATLLIVVSGKVVSLGRNSQIAATIIALNGKCTLAAGAQTQLVGALICGKKISLGANSQVQYIPTSVTLP